MGTNSHFTPFLTLSFVYMGSILVIEITILSRQVVTSYCIFDLTLRIFANFSEIVTNANFNIYYKLAMSMIEGQGWYWDKTFNISLLLPFSSINKGSSFKLEALLVLQELVILQQDPPCLSAFYPSIFLFIGALPFFSLFSLAFF